MKIQRVLKHLSSVCACLFLWSALPTQSEAQTGAATDPNVVPTPPADAQGNSNAGPGTIPYDTSTPVGPHHRWETSTDPTTGESNTYMALATGLSRWDSVAQSWNEASVQVEVFEGGAISRKTAYDAIFSPTADDPNGVFDLLMPAGPDVAQRNRFRGQCVGLAMTDRKTGQSVWVAAVTNVAGFAGQDDVSYPDCLVGERGFSASVQYKLSLAGVAQNVVLRTLLPTPSELGFPEGADINFEVWTELLDAPALGVKTESFEMDPSRFDSTIDFHGMVMRLGSGRAYNPENLAAGEPPTLGSSIAVTKEYTEIGGMRFIVESVPYDRLAPETANLRPLAALHRGRPGTQVAALGSARPKHEGQRLLPTGHDFNRSDPERQILAMAGVGDLKPNRSATVALGGYVIDWDIEATNFTDLTFRSDQTYFVKGYASLYGTVTLESAVIKFTNANTATLMIDNNGYLAVKTDTYRPSVFTASDDNTVGVTIAGSTGSPTNYYAYYALGFTSANSASISNIVVRYATRGLYFTHPTKTITNTVISAQFVNCNSPIQTYVGTCYVRNALFHNSVAIFTGYTNLFSCEHVTIDTASQLLNDLGASSLAFTNTIFCSVTNYATFSGTNYVTNTAANLFQQSGAGYHYLKDTYRNVGTATINSALKQLLGTMTTYPPVALGSTVSADTTLTPAVQRDTDGPDYGYHYPPLDYLATTTSVTGATLTLTNGVAVGFYGAEAFTLSSNAKLISEGTPRQLNRLVRYTSVQEQPLSLGSAPVGVVDLASGSTSEIRLRFTDVPLHPGTQGAKTLIADFYTNSAVLAPLVISDSQVGNAFQEFRAKASGSTIALTNNVFDGCAFTIEQGSALSLSNFVFSAYNNLYWRGSNTFNYRDTSTAWTLKDNAFLNEQLVLTSGSSNVVAANNGYTNGLTSLGGSSNVTVNAADFVTGPLGRFYYPLAGANLHSLVDKGSRTADLACLYHHTTTGPPETNSPVDIGFHYVSTEPSSDGLVGWWKLDETTGSSVSDSSGNNNNGSITGTPAWIAGQSGNALQFNGSNNLVTITESSVQRLPGDMTVAVWYRKDSETTSWPLLVGKGTNTNENFALWEEFSTGKHVLFEQYDGTNALDLWSVQTLDTNKWYHIAATVKGTTASIYVNGILDATATRSFQAPTSSLPVKFGYFGTSSYLSGALDDVRIYNRALDAGEIASLYGLSSYDTDGDGMADYFEDKNGNGTLDSGETNWQSATDFGLSVLIMEPKANSIIP